MHYIWYIVLSIYYIFTTEFILCIYKINTSIIPHRVKQYILRTSIHKENYKVFDLFIKTCVIPIDIIEPQIIERICSVNEALSAEKFS